MASLPTQSFNTIVANTIAGIQGRASKLVNFAIGSTLRAIAEGFGGVYLWFQALVLKVLQAARLSTSVGVDVDTFTADFMPTIGISNGVASPRLGSQASTGQVTYSRFTASASTCFIPVGAASQTNDGSQTTFEVIADPTFPTFSSTLNGYTLAANVASILVPIQAVVPGAAGNVVAGAISVMTSPITGIDIVTNVAAFINGADEEKDSALKMRFAAYILGLSRGDFYGLNAAILGAEVNVQWKLVELYNFDGSYRPGFFFVVADDGSGSPPAAFMQAITNAANSVRPLGIQCGVFPPQIIIANVSMLVATLPGYDHDTVVAQVAALIALNIKAVGLGNKLPYSILAAWAYSVPGVDPNDGVTGVLLNGVSGDAASISPTRPTLDGAESIPYATIKPGTIAVS